ncbi:MAG TPA: ABC transporter substrate-binding protein, partial [Herpetosiphonaceae bacterium]|nr:ABC transporter substrate-binding protein [Herpetosiphonaceae bacterium]
MRQQRLYGVVATCMLLVMILAACGAPATGGTGSTSTETSGAGTEGAGTETGGASSGAKDPVTLQLKWVAQGQFAGYYAAKEQGFYDAENLDVTIRPGGPDINPVQVVDGGQAQFGVDWLPSTLSNREKGVPLVNIAQVFQRSGMREISWKDSNITSPEDLRGKKVAVWLGGNELQL